MLWRSTLHATAVDICCCAAYRHQPSRPSRRPSSRATPRSTAPTLGRGSARTCHSLSAVRPRSGRRNCTPSSLQRRWSRARWHVRPKGPTRRPTTRPVLRAGRAGRVIGHGAEWRLRGSSHLHSGLGRLVSHCVLGRRHRRACGGGRGRRRHGCRLLGGRLCLSCLAPLEGEPVVSLLPQHLRVLRARCRFGRLPCPLATAASVSPPARTVRSVVLRWDPKTGSVIMLYVLCALGVQAAP